MSSLKPTRNHPVGCVVYGKPRAIVGLLSLALSAWRCTAPLSQRWALMSTTVCLYYAPGGSHPSREEHLYDDPRTPAGRIGDTPDRPDEAGLPPGHTRR